MEVILSIALTALIGLGASIAAAQVCTQTASNSEYTAASRQAMNALSWLGQDAQMAQQVSGAEDFPEKDLVFTWTWWDNSVNRATYSLVNGQLKRTFSSGEINQEKIVASYISDDGSLTSCSLEDGILTVTVTAVINSNSVTKSREIVPRPGLG